MEKLHQLNQKQMAVTAVMWNLLFLGWKEQYRTVAIDPEVGSWVWTGHRPGPALCKAGQSRAQDYHATSTQRLFATGQAPAWTVHPSYYMKRKGKMTESNKRKVRLSLPPEKIKFGFFFLRSRDIYV